MTDTIPIPTLAERARRIRLHALRMGEVQGQGYIAQALGIADVLAVAYFHAMAYRPDDPEWEGRDRFLLSNGHFAIAHYAALFEAGVLPMDELETYGCDDSRLPMSGMATYTPGMEISGGSLGLGLGIAVGMCLGLKRKASKSFVYNMLSDGELDEGSTWEAVMSAGHWQLDNLIALVDVNLGEESGFDLVAQLNSHAGTATVMAILTSTFTDLPVADLSDSPPRFLPKLDLSGDAIRALIA